MKNWLEIILLPIVLLFYIGCWVLLAPYMGYMLDSDCVAYLTIAERVARKDYFTSINGLWSPLNSWMIVPFINKGINAFDAAKVLNAILGGLVIIQFYFLLRKFQLSQFIRNTLLLILPLLVAYMVYFQLFGDVLQLIFILLYLSILLHKDLLYKWYFPVLAGVVMGLGFYAKAYTLMFFILHFSVFSIWKYYSSFRSRGKMILFWCFGVMSAILVVLPWSFALHSKYNEWTLTGMAGKLNMSWYINSGKSFKNDITLLIPPTYEDSPSFWEDPYLSQAKLSSPTTSPKHFMKWIVRVGHTCLVAITCLNEISSLAFALILFGWYYFFFKKRKGDEEQYDNFKLIVLTASIIPLGYLAMHIETRYIWLNSFLYLILLGFVLDRYRDYINLRAGYWLLMSVAIFSFLVFPLLQIEQLKHKNKELFSLAEELNKIGFKGKFTSNVSDAGRMWVVAYLTKNSFYTIERTNYKLEELKAEMRKYGVKYYFLEMENNVFPAINIDNSFIFRREVNGVKIFELIDE